MPALQRSIAIRGPRFYLDGEELMFVNHLDGSTREGPRLATEADREAHPGAWGALENAPADPFKPLLAFSDPEGGPPAAEEGEHAKRRRQAAE